MNGGSGLMVLTSRAGLSGAGRGGLRPPTHPLPSLSSFSDRQCLLPSAQPPAARHVVSDGEPQGDRLDLTQAADQQADQPPVPCLRVDALDRAGPLPVDLLGLVRPHPLPPLSDLLAV